MNFITKTKLPIILSALIFIFCLLPLTAQAASILPSCVPNGDCTICDILNTAIQIGVFILGIVGSLVLLMFVYGGFWFLTSGGAPDKIKKGKDILVNAVVGLAITFLAYTIVLAFVAAISKGGWTWRTDLKCEQITYPTVTGALPAGTALTPGGGTPSNNAPLPTPGQSTQQSCPSTPTDLTNKDCTQNRDCNSGDTRCGYCVPGTKKCAWLKNKDDECSAGETVSNNANDICKSLTCVNAKCVETQRGDECGTGKPPCSTGQFCNVGAVTTAGQCISTLTLGSPCSAEHVYDGTQDASRAGKMCQSGHCTNGKCSGTNTGTLCSNRPSDSKCPTGTFCQWVVDLANYVQQGNCYFEKDLGADCTNVKAIYGSICKSSGQCTVTSTGTTGKAYCGPKAGTGVIGTKCYNSGQCANACGSTAPYDPNCTFCDGGATSPTTTSGTCQKVLPKDAKCGGRKVNGSDLVAAPCITSTRSASGCLPYNTANATCVIP